MSRAISNSEDMYILISKEKNGMLVILYMMLKKEKIISKLKHLKQRKKPENI